MKTETKDQLSRIFIKALRANAGTKATVFLDFLGHINTISLEIHSKGWKPEGTWDIERRYSFRRDGIDKLNAMEAELDKLMEIKI